MIIFFCVWAGVGGCHESMCVWGRWSGGLLALLPAACCKAVMSPLTAARLALPPSPLPAQWDDKVQGVVEPFWIIVEDSDSGGWCVCVCWLVVGGWGRWGDTDGRAAGELRSSPASALM